MITRIQITTSKPSWLKKPKPFTFVPPSQNGDPRTWLSAHSALPYRYMTHGICWIVPLPVTGDFPRLPKLSA
ncbi:hypothetical protein BRIN106911_20165 [Brevibacillus invocatus]